LRHLFATQARGAPPGARGETDVRRFEAAAMGADKLPEKPPLMGLWIIHIYLIPG
jgi:hypothetical protein